MTADDTANREGMMRMILAIRESGVTDSRVLGAIESVPRDHFVPDPFKARTWDDAALPIGRHQTVSQPSVVARMTEALNVNDRMKVLEIGTGSGYQACVLAPLCRRLYTIERHAPLLKDAEARFDELRITNVTYKAGDGSAGWPEQAPFERIICTAAAADVPPMLIEQLAVGGIMVVPIGFDADDQRLFRYTKTEDDVLTEDLGPIRFVPMIEGLAEL